MGQIAKKLWDAGGETNLKARGGNGLTPSSPKSPPLKKYEVQKPRAHTPLTKIG